MRCAATLAVLLIAVPAPAQDEFGPVEGDLLTDIGEASECVDTVQQDGTIFVCRELEDAAEYRSVIPHEVDPKIRILPGFEPLPCENNLLSFCGGFGGGGNPPLMIDLSTIPEALSDADAARVTRAD